MFHALPADIEAELTFIATEHGGRKTAATSGYRPQFHYDGQDWDAEHTYPQNEWVQPGQTVTVLLTFFRPEYHVGNVYPGKQFEIREGLKVVAHGVVTKILGLEESAKKSKLGK